MKNLIKIVIIASTVFSLSGCFQRIQTGEVGVRVDMSNQVQGTELLPGSWNQTLVGNVMTFPVRDITVALDDMKPLDADNTALADFDVSVVYGVNPTSVAELYSTKSKSFHAYNEKEKDTYLMYNFMVTLVKNASYKVVRKYKTLELADSRAKMEEEIRTVVSDILKAEKLDTSLQLTMVQIRNIAPNQEIMNAATAYVKSQNELKIKENEVKLAKLESERMAALAQNSQQSIAYMNAQAALNISEGIKNGKVQTIVVPSNMTGLMIGK